MMGGLFNCAGMHYLYYLIKNVDLRCPFMGASQSMSLFTAITGNSGA